MNSNDDVKKMIRTTLLSFIIIALGLLIVCGVRPPQPSFEDLEDGASADSADLFGEELSEDDDLSALLNEEDKEFLSGDTGAEDNLFASETTSGSGDDDMNEILSLLESDEDDTALEEDNGFNFGDDYKLEDDSPVELASVSEVTSNPGGSEESDQFEGSLSSKEFTELESEADRLTEILDKKNAEAESLKTVLEQYDEKVAVMELEKSGAGSAYKPPQPSMSHASSGNRERSKPVVNRSTTPRSNYNSVQLTAGPKKSSKKRSPFESKFQAAVKDFSTARYKRAMEQFEHLLYMDAENALADNCQYYMGECCFAQDKYTQAVIEFEKVFVFDNNDKADDAQMKLGMSFMKKGETDQAKMEFDNLLAFYSDSEFARKARNYLKQL